MLINTGNISRKVLSKVLRSFDKNFERLQEQNVLYKKISEEMNKKNPRWYEAMVLVYYMDMPQVKAAELMGINLRTLHSLLHRAKNWIKKNYKAEYEEMNRED